MNDKNFQAHLFISDGRISSQFNLKGLLVVLKRIPIAIQDSLLVRGNLKKKKKKTKKSWNEGINPGYPEIIEIVYVTCVIQRAIKKGKQKPSLEK